MPSSSPIVTGEQYTADDINALRDDVLSGHTHNGTDGAVVPFNNLGVTGTGGSLRPSGGNVSYDEIEAHIAGSQGAHGLPSNSYVVGSTMSGMMIQGGVSSFIGNQRGITFSPAFDTGTTPVVVATYAAVPTDVNNPTETTAIYVLDVTPTGCTVYTAEAAQWGGKQFSWMAFGRKSS